jgi:SAM-dependent methyltransferase
MKKDFVPADKDMLAAEIDFVEDFWTQRWESQAALPAPETVTLREEYKIMLPYLKGLPRGCRILDGGCGMGEWTVFLATQGFNTVGVDISERTIRRLQQNFLRGKFLRGDIRATGLEDASFDAYFSWGTFEHFETGLGECINEAYRVLKPGGLLFISVPFQNWRHILREMSPRYRWCEAFDITPGTRCSMRFYQWRFTKADLRQELEMRGFVVEKFMPIHKGEGWRRALVWDVHLRQGTRIFALADRFLGRLLPAPLIAHMIVAVARKSNAGNGDDQNRNRS